MLYELDCSNLTNTDRHVLNDWTHLNEIDDDSSFELSDHTWCSFLLQMCAREVNTVICLTSCLKTLFSLFQVVKKSLVTFVNKHLNKINLEVTELESQFSDGVSMELIFWIFHHLRKNNWSPEIRPSWVYHIDFWVQVYLCLLSGLLEGYFVPLYDFHLTPQVPYRF